MQHLILNGKLRIIIEKKPSHLDELESPESYNCYDMGRTFEIETQFHGICCCSLLSFESSICMPDHCSLIDLFPVLFLQTLEFPVFSCCKFKTNYLH